MSPLYTFHAGTLPLLISVPHAGTELPVELARRFTSTGGMLPDTDWYVDKLYEFAHELGASVIVANYSRYVVDLNRSPDSAPLYPSAPSSPVCTSRTFQGELIYMSGMEPTEAEMQARTDQYWRPYHARIEQELTRLRGEHGVALLWDAHSIASQMPQLFAGVLPEFNLGTRDDSSCPREIAAALLDVVTRDGKYGAVLNGRFKGGYITQHYGRPVERMYAVQLELAQRMYMDERHPLRWDADLAHSAAEMIKQLLRRFLSLAQQATS